MNVWFKCKGCGEPAAYFGDGLPPHYPPGSVGHSKPAGLVRASYDAPSQVTCLLYHQLNAAEFWYVHQDAERLPDPETFEPILL